jgi:hypothetical protein
VRSWTVLLAALSVFTLIAGCTSQEPGTASADPTDSTSTSSEDTSSSSTSGSETPTVEIPPRPKDLSLDGLDPCTLFTPAQRTELKADKVQSETSNSDHYKGMRECVLDVSAQDPFYTYAALAVTNEDVSFWLTGDRNADAKLISVGGYPAAQFNTKGVDTDCVVAVGVAEGQHLQVEMTPWSDGFTQEDICQASKQAAEMALETLQTLN